MAMAYPSYSTAPVGHWDNPNTVKILCRNLTACLSACFFFHSMFFETTYVPSPQLSATSTIDEDDLSSLPPSPTAGPTKGDTSGDEGLYDSPVDHVIFVIHVYSLGHQVCYVVKSLTG
ncbi:hypothetical protein BX666DRAFT_2090 [Dichotomocladium elegans]|nr:hypothetical protein BX666DRAFT_2090 [Dichotomocladium elegans]